VGTEAVTSTIRAKRGSTATMRTTTDLRARRTARGSRTFPRALLFQTLLGNICLVSITNECKRCIEVLTKVIGSDANDNFVHILEVVPSIPRVEKCVKVVLDQIAEGLLVVEDNDITWGCGVVALKSFGHNGSSFVARVANCVRVYLGQIVERVFIANNNGVAGGYALVEAASFSHRG
jgi:hypothetical protein